MSNQQLLDIKKIRVMPELQARHHLNTEVVSDYAEALQSGCEFPPVTVVDTLSALLLVDGFHRFHAHLQLGRNEILAIVTKGSNLDALKAALAANAQHGLQRTRNDKAKAVEMALDDPEIEALSDREIAELCCVSHTFVAKQRRILVNTPYPNSSSMPARVARTMQKVETLPPVWNEAETYAPDYDPAKDAMLEIARENEQLRDRLAVEAMDFSEEEKTMAADTIAELREEVRKLQIINTSLVISRDQFQNENAQLKKQVVVLQRKLTELELQGVVSLNSSPF